MVHIFVFFEANTFFVCFETLLIATGISYYTFIAGVLHVGCHWPKQACYNIHIPVSNIYMFIFTVKRYIFILRDEFGTTLRLQLTGWDVVI